jgi:hypothetical protein
MELAICCRCMYGQAHGHSDSEALSGTPFRSSLRRHQDDGRRGAAGVQPVCTDFIGPWAAVAVAAYMQVQLATRRSVY